jgi:hypothetical protein
MTGVVAIQIFQTQIFLEMKQKGSFQIPVIWAVQIVNLISVVANFLSFYP